MAKAILPILDDAVARGVAKLIQLRPSAAPFVISGEGVYADAFFGWRAQLALLRRRLADEALSRRLPLAKGRALVELARSEFFAEIDPAPQKAVARIVVRRTTGAMPAGTIKKGTKFRKVADPSAAIPVADAAYVSTDPVPVASGQSFPIIVTAEAVSAGPEANVPFFSNAPNGAIILDDSSIFDPALFVQSYADVTAAGGSSGPRDEDIVALAKAMYLGQYAPTKGALLAGALTDAGVKHVAFTLDPVLGQHVLFVADESWATSDPFTARCAQIVKDNWLGFGCRIDVRSVFNVLAALSATVVLRSPKFADDTTEMREKIRAKVQSYFDARPDFWTFNLNTLGGIISRADPMRILTCTTVALTDGLTGATLTPEVISPTRSHVSHYVLPDSGITLTTKLPS